MPLRRSLLLVALTLLLLPTPAQAAGVVQPLWDITTPSGGPFPTDIFTTADPTQLTGRSVDLPKPNCATRPSDCEDVDVLNDLDGFNPQPRISIPFSGEINPATATSDSVFLVRLPDGAVTGINQVVWDPATDTLHVESDQLLDQHTRYLLVVTRKLLDAEGSPVATGMRRIHPLGPWFANRQYFRDLDLALLTKLPAGVARSDVVAASLFTTQSVTALLEKVRNQIKAATPAPASFLLGPGGSRTVFSLADVTSVVFTRQVRTAATPTLPMFTSSPLPTPALSLYPNSVGTIAFGAYDSPDYETAAKVIPAVGSATGTPVPQGVNRIQFNLFLPAGAAPAGGWPVAIYGHGFTDSMHGSPYAVASSMARRGIATVAINVVGHGGGALGTLTVSRTSGAPVTLAAGGRGIDQNGDGAIDSSEGSSAAPPYTLVSSRDGLRQTVIDLMQLVREIEVGMDVDGNGTRDLDASRISYFGQSFGGIYGTKFLAIEPNVRAGVPNVPGGSIIEIVRLSPVFRPLVWLSPRRPDTAAGEPAGPVPVQREHAAAEPAAGGEHGAGLGADPDGDREQRVGAAGGEPGALRTAPAEGAARGDAAEVDHPPVRARRPDRAQPDDVGDHPGGRPPAADDALPQRPRVRGEPGLPEEPALVPDADRRCSRAGRPGGARGPGSDRRLLRLGRDDGRRSGRARAALRDADGRAAAGGPGLHPVS